MAITASTEGRKINWVKAARVAWAVLAFIALVVLIASLPGYMLRFDGQLAHVPGDQMTNTDRVFAVLSGMASFASSALSIMLAWLLYRQRFDRPLPAALSAYLLIYAIVMAGPLEHLTYYWFDSFSLAVALQGVLLGIPTFTLLMLFPDGRFVPSWTRWAFYLSIPWGISFVFTPEPTAANFANHPVLFTILAAGSIITMVVGIYAQIYRYRYVSNPEQRQQTKWAIFGFGLWILYIMVSSVPYIMLTSLEPGQQVPWWTGLSELGWWLSLNIIPITLTIAMTRYQLWNIDQVINRTLVYSALTAAIVAIYVLLVGGLSLLFQTSNRPWMPLIATGLAAVLFQPLRARMQAFVNRMMYGDRDDPASVLSRLGDQLEKTASPENTLNKIVETVAQTLKLPYAAIEWGAGAERVTSYGLPAQDTEDLPLIYQGQMIGRMRVAPRAEGEPLSTKDLQLLENIAHQASAVLHNAQLTADLLDAREYLVTSREEERRRIRRDLHDGLGPELAGLTLKLDAARNLLSSDPAAAEQLLQELKQQSQAAIGEIRGLVYNLRPPALDEFGLVQALKEHAASLPTGEGPAIHFHAPESLPQLPAAVEVAAYRIALEALNNVQRHSSAENCWVELKLNDGLTLEIRDDGIGIEQDYEPGVGLVSMRERTDELGADLKLSSQPGSGTTLSAFFPLVQTDES